MKRYHPRSRSFDLLSAYDWFIPGWIDFLWIGITLLAGVILALFATLSLTKAGFAPIYIQLISYPLMFIPTMLLASSLSRRNLFRGEPRPLDRNKNWNAASVLTAVAGMLALAFLCDPVTLLLPPMPENLLNAMKMLGEGPLWASLLCTCVFAPFFEEWLCRGIVLRGLLGKTGALWAIPVSAVFFALIHANLWQGIPAFLTGLFLGYVYWKTGSLKTTMLMHAANNLASVLVMRIPGWEEAETFYELFPVKAWYWLAFAGAAVVFVLAVKFTGGKNIPRETETA